MRGDMRKVVREMARGGSFFRNHDTAMRIDPRGVSAGTLEDLDDMDFGPKRIPMSMRSPLCGTGYGLKSTGFRSGILERFLCSRVGRPWNKVYAEFRRRFDHRRPENLEIIRDFSSMVEQHCYFGEDGQLYSERWGWRSQVSGLYVHPQTGILSRLSEARSFWKKPKDRFGLRIKKFWKDKKFLESAGLKGLDMKNIRVVSEGIVLENRDGIWFIYTLTPYTSKDKVEVWRMVWVKDPITNKAHTERVSFLEPYTPEPHRPSIRVVSVHQMNKKLIRKYSCIIAGNPY